MSALSSAQTFAADAVAAAPMDLFIDAGFAPRLKAEEFRAEDIDGILDGVTSTGNLNFAVIHAGLVDDMGASRDSGAAGAHAADLQSGGAFGAVAAASFGPNEPGAEPGAALDVHSLFAPLDDIVADAREAIGALDIAADSSMVTGGRGESGDQLIGDLALELGFGDEYSGTLGDADLPEPDSILSEGLPLLDDALGGLDGAGGGLFG